MNCLLKLLSGRFFLTICAGFSFVRLVVNQSIDAKDAMVVILLVANWYFTRERAPKEPKQ